MRSWAIVHSTTAKSKGFQDDQGALRHTCTAATPASRRSDAISHEPLDERFLADTLRDVRHFCCGHFCGVAMFKHILIATDGSELAAKAVTTGLELAKALGAKVTFVSVTEPRTHLVPVSLPPVLTEDDEALKRAAETVLEMPAQTRPNSISSARQCMYLMNSRRRRS